MNNILPGIKTQLYTTASWVACFHLSLVNYSNKKHLCVRYLVYHCVWVFSNLQQIHIKISSSCCSLRLTNAFFLTLGEVGVNNIVCPGGSECLDYETCCPVTGGGYGCCPLPQAVCCSDLEHCCPCGYRCDLTSDTCIQGDKRIPMLSKKKAIPARRIQGDDVKVEQKPQVANLDEKLRFVPRSAQHSSPSCSNNQCRSYHTCCMLPSGGSHCCPLPQASCCADGLHCCPQGYVCDQKSSKCKKENEAIPMINFHPKAWTACATPTPVLA